MMQFIVGGVAVLVMIATLIGGASAADAADKIKEGAKNLGSKISDTAKDIKDGTVSGTKKAGAAIGDKYDDVKDSVTK